MKANMEIKPEWIQDNIDIGNINVALPYSTLAIRNNPHLSVGQKRKACKTLARLQNVLNMITTKAIFKDE